MKGNILFVMSPFLSHLVPTFKLSQHFKSRGYNVVYISTLKLKSLIEENGYTFQNSFVRNENNKVLKTEELVPYYISIYNPFISIIEVSFWNWALYLKGLQENFIMIQTWPCDNRAFGLKPNGYCLLKDKGIISLIKNKIQWIKHNIDNKKNYYKNKVNERHDKIVKLAKLNPDKKYISKKNRITYYQIDGTTELILYPSELDVPRKNNDSTRFIGPFVDVNRQEPAFDWSDTNYPTNTIIYCSLGSLSHSCKHRLAFYDKLIKAFTNRQNMTLIMSVGKNKEQFHNKIRTKNIHLLDFAPQIEILKRASLFITHGGAGSMKEALYYGVPMLVYPWNGKTDRFGNADRIQFHKLGDIGDFENDSSSMIIRRIDSIISNKEIELNIIKMKSKFKDYENNELKQIDFILNYKNSIKSKC